MSSRRETNVRVLPCVLQALDRIAVERGVSRDEAVRQVLAEHVSEQEARAPKDRVTHISTVLRHPRPASGGRERVDRPLRLRLPIGLAERARAVSLQLPGQHPRAHKDYVARLLTDAVVTAVAVQEPFTDAVLDGLLPVLRHKAAHGLWHLAVAVTSTRPERAIQDAAEYLYIQPLETLALHKKRLLRVSRQLDHEAAWHASFRFVVAANLAHHFLAGDGAVANENLLYEQDEEWNERRLDLRNAIHPCHWFTGADEWGPCEPDRRRCRWYMGDSAGWDPAGRGAAAVWRAQRMVDIEDFTDWLLTLDGHAPASQVVACPGWAVRSPAGWATYVVPHDHELPTRIAQWAAEGQVLVFPLGDRQVVWPVRPGHHLPVPGAEPLVTAAHRLRPQEIPEFIEAVLVEWGINPFDTEDHTWDDVDPSDAIVEAEFATPQLWLPVDKAFEFGFVDAEQRRIAMVAAREHTRELPHTKTNTEPVVAKPAPTLDPEFRLLITRRKKRRTAKPTWRWPGGSVAHEVFAGTSPAVVEWLAGRALWMTRWIAHYAMERAWHDGFDHYPKSFWRPGGITDDQLV